MKNDEIIITRPDKGNGIVILDRQDYIDKTITLLSDSTKFRIKDGNVYSIITSLSRKLNLFLEKLMKTKKISYKSYRHLRSKGAKPGILYSLPKIHKLNNPMRPIMSAIGTFNYKLCKFLVPVLEPLISNEYTLTLFPPGGGVDSTPP